MVDKATDERLRHWLEAYGIDTTEGQRELMLHHLELVQQKNRVINLTRITDPSSAVILHLVDSLLLLPAVCEAPAGCLLDMGTGAGFPGMPLCIVSGRQGLLVDSVGKKVAAVQEFIGELGLEQEVQASKVRIEELAQSRRGEFPVVVARAVARMATLVEYATPLLQKQGRLVITKGRLSEDEYEAGRRAARLCGMKVVSRETCELPLGLGHREIVTVERVSKSRVRLPRKVGMAQHQPLGGE